MVGCSEWAGAGTMPSPTHNNFPGNSGRLFSSWRGHVFRGVEHGTGTDRLFLLN